MKSVVPFCIAAAICYMWLGAETAAYVLLFIALAVSFIRDVL